MSAVTDPQRVRRQDPGNPDVCPIFYLHKAYSPPETIAEVDRECRVAGIGCVDCKKRLLVSLLPSLERHRKARAEVDKTPERVEAVLKAGAEKAGAVAEATMKDVREAMQL
jgi:tryptophanyl-tRNA synthetase